MFLDLLILPLVVCVQEFNVLSDLCFPLVDIAYRLFNFFKSVIYCTVRCPYVPNSPCDDDKHEVSAEPLENTCVNLFLVVSLCHERL